MTTNPSLLAVTLVNKWIYLALIKVTKFYTLRSSKLLSALHTFLKDNATLTSFIISIWLMQCALLIKLHTLLTLLAESIGLYINIWQTLYAVRHSLFPLSTLGITSVNLSQNTLSMVKSWFQSPVLCSCWLILPNKAFWR